MLWHYQNCKQGPPPVPWSPWMFLVDACLLLSWPLQSQPCKMGKCWWGSHSLVLIAQDKGGTQHKVHLGACSVKKDWACLMAFLDLQFPMSVWQCSNWKHLWPHQIVWHILSQQKKLPASQGEIWIEGSLNSRDKEEFWGSSSLVHSAGICQIRVFFFCISFIFPVPSEF
jgi:hypothetical protein